tara:strand:+ start:309 stop:770 length:462 start_codon:yes stop_codon:yes gene_type:complete
MTRIQDIPRRGDMFVPAVKNVKVTKIFSDLDTRMYNVKLAQMGIISSEGLNIRFIIWQKSVIEGIPLLRLNATYDIFDSFTNSNYGETMLQLSKRSKIQLVENKMSDYLDVSFLETPGLFDDLMPEKLNIRVANSHLLVNKFTYAGPVKEVVS